MKRRVSLTLTLIFCLSSQNLQGQSLNKFIDAYARGHNFSGTILIQNKTRIAYERSFGIANRQLRVPNKMNQKYKIASITKAFTAVLILMVYEQGKIDLLKTIKTYLPDYTGEAGGKVTIHQLLNHTSGMPNIDRSLTSAEAAIKNGMPHYQTPLTTDELVRKYCSEPLVNEPGKVFDYNNADYIILGKVIEKVYGKTYEQVLTEKILVPLDMRDTGLLYQYKVVPNLADTYFYRDDIKQVVNDLPVYIENWYASGAMYSTTEDLLKFSNALFGEMLIKQETLALMLKPGFDDYGYGVWVYETKIKGKSYRVFKRPGRIMGAQGMLFHILNGDATIIILSNTDAVSMDEFAAEISKRLMK